VAGLSSTAALLAAAGGASWYYASRLTEAPADIAEPPPVPDDLATVVAVDGDRVTLAGPDAGREGFWGLDTPSAYLGLLPDVDVAADGTARRSFEVRLGTPVAGQQGLLDPYAWPPDGATLQPPAEDVTYSTPLGDAPAWFVPGTSSTWAIAVHGRAAVRHEAFRITPVLAALGLPVLSIAYRNDREGPRSPDNRSHLGATEWQDVEAAIDHAVAHGAEEIVLVGFSMGGACAVACVRLSDRAERVRGLVLDAPVLDWGPVVKRAAIERGLPAAVLPALLPATMALARARVGIDWGELTPDPTALAHPTLLIHGDEDATVPVELSDAFAAARPDIVTYLRVAGAGHVRSWNTARGAYEAAVRDFVTGLIAG
jgi:uncharacterized protein